jgi:vitellogenic carboxypeptidase-like protein
VQPFVRAALGVGSIPYQDGNTQVEISLGGDVMFSQKDNLAFLLSSGIKVLLYNGALDIICGAPLTDAYIPTVQWPGAAAFAAAPRAIWHEPATGNVAGWASEGGGLTRVVIKGAGHIAPYDQPGRTQDMITRFISGGAWN